MSSLLPLRTAAAGIALALALAVPAASAAIAQESETRLQQVYHTGQNDAFGAQHDLSIAAARSAGTAPLVASTVPMVQGKPDLVGNHGPQDALAKQIYQPGSRPAGW